MRAFLARRDRDGRASRRLQQAREWVDGHSSTKMVYWEVSFFRVAQSQYTLACTKRTLAEEALSSFNSVVTSPSSVLTAIDRAKQTSLTCGSFQKVFLFWESSALGALLLLLAWRLK